MQDVFHVIPGDTDYRIFSQDFGNIPGLDIIFLLGGYFYHTSYDTVEQLLYVSYLHFWAQIFYFHFILFFLSCNYKVELPTIDLQLFRPFSRPRHSGSFIVPNIPFYIIFPCSMYLMYFYVSRPGSIQARGENLFSVIKAFTNSTKLRNIYQTNYSEVTASLFKDERAVFFDYLSWFMVCTEVCRFQHLLMMC